MGDQLFIYGGTTALGTTTELLAYNLVSQTWAVVAPSSPAPSIMSDIGYGAGCLVGRHIYQFVQSIDSSGSPMPNTGQLWRWAPSAGGGGGGGGGGGAAAAETPPALTAGVAIAVLVGIANLAATIYMYLNPRGGGRPVSVTAMGDVYSGL